MYALLILGAIGFLALLLLCVMALCWAARAGDERQAQQMRERPKEEQMRLLLESPSELELYREAAREIASQQ